MRVKIVSVRRIAIAILLLVACNAPEAMPEKPTQEDSRAAAIGSRKRLPAPLARAVDPAAFEPLDPPGPSDWLASHHENGQTFVGFARSNINRPDAQRHTIYLQPLGTFNGDAPSLDFLQRYTAAFFMLDVRLLPPVTLDTAIRSRMNPYSGRRQLLTGDLLDLLRRRLPADAFCIIGITMEDLYPGESWNFVFGQASLTDRVGVYSFARYGGGTKETMLRRSCKVMTHETAHMFGVTHCIWYRCVMNGSNHLAETDARPMHLCAVDLRKLLWSVRFDVTERYRRLRDLSRESRFDDEAQWLDAQLARIEGG